MQQAVRYDSQSHTSGQGQPAVRAMPQESKADSQDEIPEYRFFMNARAERFGSADQDISKLWSAILQVKVKIIQHRERKGKQNTNPKTAGEICQWRPEGCYSVFFQSLKKERPGDKGKPDSDSLDNSPAQAAIVQILAQPTDQC
jgi:hypothetical protein